MEALVLPQDYTFISEHSASIGFDVISISYPNNVPAASLASSSNQFAFDNIEMKYALVIKLAMMLKLTF